MEPIKLLPFTKTEVRHAMAVQFTGGPENAEQIVSWLLSHNLQEARWRPHHVLHRESGSPEEKPEVIELERGGYPGSAKVGDWIVLWAPHEDWNSNIRFDVVTDDFRHQFLRNTEHRFPVCQHCLADPRHTKIEPADAEDSEGKKKRCPVCGSAYTGPRRSREFQALVEAGLVISS